MLCPGAAACCPRVQSSRVRSSRARAGFMAAHYLPALDRLRGCPEGSCWIAPALRRRPVEQPHDASHAELLIVSSRRLRFARWAAHLPVKRARGFPARAARVFCILISRRLGGTGRSAGLPPSVRAWQIGCFAIWAFSSPQGAAAGAQPRRRGLALHQLPPCEASCRTAARKAQPTVATALGSHLAAPCDAARLEL